MNEAGNVFPLIERTKAVFANVLKGYQAYFLFVDDGSTDDTLAVLRSAKQQYKDVHYLSLSRNFGHQNALKAGLDNARGNCVISMDGDLQHPPEFIPQLIEAWEDGFLVVNTIRKNINTGLFKRATSGLFYKTVNNMGDTSIVPGSADFRLLDRAVLDHLSGITEWPLFYRGLVPWLGFKTRYLSYNPELRTWGSTKYSIRKMISFALNGITSFSIKPLRIAIYLGLLISSFAFCYALYAVWTKVFTSKALEGWTSLAVLISFLSGLQLLILGIIGEYLGKLFIAQKKRPLYIIEERDCE
jgi:dolichol-phosphate mannosyltransferase